MATATVARPSQPLRRTRDAPRPVLGKRSINLADGSTNSTQLGGKRRKLDEPYVWDSEYILKKHRGKAPSLTIHLHPTHFKFEGQDGSFPYDSEMKFVLEHLRRNTVPHQMMEQLLENNVQFYDGCLIVEVHNHRIKQGSDSKAGHGEGNKDKHSMHRYTPYITPSPYAPYPDSVAQAREETTPDQDEKRRMPAPDKAKQKDKEKVGPQIFTTVLHPTELSRHHEMLILAETPADQLRGNKKRTGDGATPSTAQPPTPSLSVPPTPLGATARATQGSQKMCVDEGNMYDIEAEMLITTNPPLFLNPVDNPQDSDRVLELLQHPLHQEAPPSPKARKKTTAEVAADDAQQQEIERRMLIMDERIKPSGTGAAANETQGAAASLTFSRFKTIDLVRQRLEEAERIKKEEDLQAAALKKQNEEQAKLAELRRQQMVAQQAQGNPQAAQQALLMKRQEQIRAQMLAQQQAAQQANNQHHGHPQQHAMMQNQVMGQGGPVQMPQSSPVVRQQTPMMNSSPMLHQGGFPMAQTSSQGMGSPARPTSAAMQHHPMARQVSQQQGSRHATPQMAQGTPSMGQAIPNRQMAQTPRMPPGSPATGMQHGTPVPNALPMQTPHLMNQSQLTPEQIAMIQQQRALQQGHHGGLQAGSPAHNMTPEQIQNIKTQQMIQRARILQAQAQAQAQGNPQLAMQLQQQEQQNQKRMAAMFRQQQMMAIQGSPAPGQAGSPGQMPQQTPQMAHAHPMQHAVQTPHMQGQDQIAMAQARASALARQRAEFQQRQQAAAQQQHLQGTPQPQQQANAMTIDKMQREVNSVITQYGGLTNIPPQVINSLGAPAKQYIISELNKNRRAQQFRQQQRAMAQQGNNNGGDQVVPAQQPNPHYMQQLRQSQAMLAQNIQMQNAGMGGMNGMTGMSFQMGGMNGGQAQGQQGNGADLTQQFAAMQNALARGQGQQGGGQ